MYNKLLVSSIILALIVVVLGAYTRLSDAGLGCPDWPGCYGKIIVPDMADGTQIEGYERPLEVAKGWKEMLHRYAASTLGLFILILWLLALKGKTPHAQSMVLPSFTALFVMLQGAFGMWTVTLMVHPGIVTTHLVGGFITSALLVWLYLNQNRRTLIDRHILKRHKYLLLLVLFALSVQVILGGWTSTNYAALSCGDQFPTCLDAWWPNMDFSKAFILFRSYWFRIQLRVRRIRESSARCHSDDAPHGCLGSHYFNTPVVSFIGTLCTPKRQSDASMGIVDRPSIIGHFKCHAITANDDSCTAQCGCPIVTIKHCYSNS